MESFASKELVEAQQEYAQVLKNTEQQMQAKRAILQDVYAQIQKVQTEIGLLEKQIKALENLNDENTDPKVGTTTATALTGTLTIDVPCNIDEYIIYQSKYKRIITKKNKMNKYSKTTKYIEAQYYKDRFYQPIKKHKINFKYLEIDELCFSALDEICSKLYYFSYGVNIFKIGHKNFIKYQAEKYKGFKLLNMISAKLLDSLTRSKKYSATSIFITYTPTKKDYLNKENKLWIYKNSECYKSFTDIYNDALNVSSKLITLVSEEIFYKTPKTIEIKNLLDQIRK
jgi:hypothetical protein